MTPNTIRLDDVDDVYPGYGLPAIDDFVEAPGRLDDLIEDDLGAPSGAQEEAAVEELAVLRKEVVRLGRGLRTGRGAPASAMHVLLLADGLTLGQISGRLHRDPRDVEAELLELQRVGLVARSRDGLGLARFSIVGLSEL